MSIEVTSLPEAKQRPRHVAIGTFDGVHRGHQAVIEGADTVLTFDPHPLEVLHPAALPKLIMTAGVKRDVLDGLGVDELVVIPFDREFASHSAEDFVDHVLVETLSAEKVSVGENFRFGAKASGDTTFLREAGERAGFAVDGLALDGGAVPYSSTLVRTLVAEGRLLDAAEVLGRPHEVSGIVTKGDQRGRELGFPTANVPVDEAYAVPPDGVYAGWLVRADGERLPAAISVGTNPTFDGVERRVESYVLDRTDLELYGEAVRVELIDRLRGMVKYEGIEPLVAQMHQDVEKTRAILQN